MSADPKLFDAVAGALARQPGSSMKEIAEAAGVGRTTLHRAFGERTALIERVGRHVLADCERLFDEAGIDETPVMEAFDALVAAPLRLGKAYALLFTEPGVYRDTGLLAEIRSQDDRFERYFARGQAAGAFRSDLPPRWLVYSVGTQMTALWWAVDDGIVGARDAARVLRATLVGGIAAADAAAAEPGEAGS